MKLSSLLLLIFAFFYFSCSKSASPTPPDEKFSVKDIVGTYKGKMLKWHRAVGDTLSPLKVDTGVDNSFSVTVTLINAERVKIVIDTDQPLDYKIMELPLNDSAEVADGVSTYNFKEEIQNNGRLSFGNIMLTLARKPALKSEIFFGIVDSRLEGNIKINESFSAWANK